MTFHSRSYYWQNPHVCTVLEWGSERRDAIADVFAVAADRLDDQGRRCGDTLNSAEGVAIATCGQLASVAGRSLPDAEVAYLAHQRRHAAVVHVAPGSSQELSEWVYGDTSERDVSALVYSVATAAYLFRAAAFTASLHGMAQEFRVIADALRAVPECSSDTRYRSLSNRP